MHDHPIDWWRFVVSIAGVALYAKLWVIGRDVADLHTIAFPFRRSREAAREASSPTCQRCGLPFNPDELDEDGVCAGCFADRGTLRQ